MILIKGFIMKVDIEIKFWSQFISISGNMVSITTELAKRNEINIRLTKTIYDLLMSGF